MTSRWQEKIIMERNDFAKTYEHYFQLFYMSDKTGQNRTKQTWQYFIYVKRIDKAMYKLIHIYICILTATLCILILHMYTMYTIYIMYTMYIFK